jgi:hypothetical protein
MRDIDRTKKLLTGKRPEVCEKDKRGIHCQCKACRLASYRRMLEVK